MLGLGKRHKQVMSCTNCNQIVLLYGVNMLIIQSRKSTLLRLSSQNIWYVSISSFSSVGASQDKDISYVPIFDVRKLDGWPGATSKE